MVFRPVTRYATSGTLGLCRVSCEFRKPFRVYFADACVFGQGLQLTREILVHEKYLDEARARVKELEVDVAKLRAEKQNTVVPSTGKSTRSWFGW